MAKILVLYHYFHPDDVVSAQLFTGLCEGLRDRGWQVEAISSNRGHCDDTQKFSARENWNGIEVRRLWRPRFRQSSRSGRLLNAAWMICAWSLLAFRKKHIPDVLVVGTDPVLSVLVAIFWKMIRPRMRIVHWCFDLYPEAAIADGVFRDGSFMVRIFQYLLRLAYKNCAMIVDIGSCMRKKLEVYESGAQEATLTPWALAEPRNALQPDSSERETIFGDPRLGLMYSGNFGRAHSYDLILQLMRRLRGENINLALSVRGNCVDLLQSAVLLQDDNVKFVPFAPQERLWERLSAADIHIVSLRERWTGTVVPSKFFGALAIGRPVIFSGSPDSAIAKWIKEYRVGWVLQPETLQAVAAELEKLAVSRENMRGIFEHCHNIYQEHFSKKYILDRWDKELRLLLQEMKNVRWKR